MEMELSPKEAQAYIKKTPNLVLIDVRQPDEHKEARIAQSKLMPLGTLPARLSEINRDQPLLFYCAAGGRSAQALAFAQQQGYTEARHVLGGISAWAQAGLPYES